MAEDQATEHAEAVAALVAEQYGQLVGYARKRLRVFDVPPAWVDADDVVQNALASVLARSEPVEKLRPYIFTVVKNEAWHAAQRYRTGQPYGSLDADVQLEAAGPAADPSGAADRRLDLADALDALPPQQRKAVVLNKALEFTQAETATVMKTAPGTVATHVHRAMVALRVTLGALGLALVAWGTAWLWGQRKKVIPAAGLEKVKDLNVLQLSLSVLAFVVVAVGVGSYASARPDREPRTWWERLGVRLRKSLKQLTNGPGGFAGND
ncbi:RNA polymerase sigma factor (plasmid) [Streptomyces hygroscopicus subsp. jinggangensis 5008]|nr:RNA polymerase sigma factor [Streptomyces hygroscopicus subsp. jinggangensis 5008]AGF68477.1 RNA polymerase sigma factor [Streptomyces hygroscopicus subsp. jinggangensis TL01]